MKKVAISLLLSLSLGLTACTASEKKEAPAPAATPAAPAAAPAPTAEKPMVVDKATRTIRIYATVNGKYLHEPTRHGLNFKEGKAAPMALFVTPLNQLDFYDALMDLQAKPGNNVKEKGDTVQGQPLDVKVTWEKAGKEYGVDEVVVDSTGKKIAYRFGGNLENSKKYMTGCMLCLDSCPVGIASNSAHSYGEFDGKQVEFRGNKDLLPGDGNPVTIIVQVKDA